MSLKILLQKLVAIPSFSGKEIELATSIKKYFVDKGASIIEHEGNVMAHIKKGSQNAIIFNAHMDTVRPGDASLWKTDPLVLSESDGKYFGLGIGDEKVSIALLMDIFDDLAKTNIDVFLAFVVKEEIDGSGSKTFVDYFKKNYTYDKVFCVLCEPTDGEYVELGNKGNIFFEITAQGKSAHSSRPEEGENAVIKLVNTIDSLQGEFKKNNKFCDKLGPATFACPTVIQGGSSVNVIPDICVAKGDIRTNSLCHDDMVTLLTSDPSIQVISETKPYLLDDSHPFVMVFEKIGITQKKYTTGSNDAIFFGMAGIPTLVFGAGTKASIHKPNEFVEIKNIDKTNNIYLR
ncbi:MAG TPA: M20/M25/M40 family metallo-hydrolase, partial [Candidatus Nanoarchaeia archaeon]|nr:M20/M25/M40 family metallo-hydrolase [Candidatus Nanoarchaeia archaeon]